MTTVTEPVKTYTNVPRPVEAPFITAPQRAPEAVPVEERELVPVRRPGQGGTSSR